MIDSIVGLVLAGIAGVVMIWQELLIYTEAVRRPLVGGGIFGLMVGIIMAKLMPIGLKTVIPVGLIGVLSVGLFNRIVRGEEDFQGRSILLYLLPFLVTLTLSFLGVCVSAVMRREN